MTTPKLTPEDLAKLPLSALLRLAVKDSQEFEAAGGVLDMTDWLGTDDNGRCYACMAGSVMRRTCDLRSRYEVNIQPGTRAWHPFHAIDEMRTGRFVGAYRLLYGALVPDWLRELELELTRKFTSDEEGFDELQSWSTYLECADMLEKAGL